MVGWLIFSSVILMLLAYLMFAPFFIELNSQTGLMRIRFHRLLNAQLLMIGGSLIIDLKLAWWHKRIDILNTGLEKQQTIQPRVRVRGVKKKKRAPSWRKIVSVLNSFVVKKCVINLCFDNMRLNGILYPLFRWVNLKTGQKISINFVDENEVELELKNNCFRVIRAYMS